MKDLQEVLLQRLRNKGLESDLIPGFIKIMAQAMVGLSDVGLEEVNTRLHFLGWDDFDLDDHTLQLIIANLEANESMIPEFGEKVWPDSPFHPGSAAEINS